VASPRPSLLARIDRVLAPLTWVAAALVVVLLFAGPELIGAKDDTAGATAKPAKASGATVFSDAGCGGCHTFKAAGSSGAVGPNLDEIGLDAAAIEAVVTSGKGSMPAFGSRLSSAEVAAVASYVASGGAEEPAATATATATAGGEPAVAATIRAGRGPDGITVDGDGTVWVANATAGTLVHIPAGAKAPEGGPTPAGRQPDSPVVAGGVVWLVASGDDTVLRVKGSDTTRIPAGREPSGLAVDERSVWVANAGDGTVTRIDRASGEVEGAPIQVGRRPADVAAADGVVWVTNFDDGTVTRIDAGSGRVTGEPIEVGRRPRGIAIGEGSVWVANAGDATVSRIDPAGGAVSGDPIPVGENPRELAVGEGSIWVANAGDGTVTRIDPSGKVVGDPIEVGEDPIGIAAGGGSVYTADFRGDTVTQIRP
jgi:serine/threonine-protein kinase